MTYSTWITPVKNLPGVYNTRTSLGPWSDRIGVIAYALTPLSVLLSCRESVLSLVTGIPYQSFMFLHRWLGYIIIVQSALHTIGWCVVEWRLYQPQPSTWNTLIAEPFIIWGVAAMVLLILMLLFSMRWVVRTAGYEFFRKSHYVLAMVYIGAIIGHWPNLQCFLVPSLVIWFLDRLARAVRTVLLHYRHLPSGGMGFAAAQAVVTRFPDQENGDILRLEVKHRQAPWQIGQHFYLCFPEDSIWQSHPFTPLNAPTVGMDGAVRHSYIFRAKRGQTRKMAELARRKAVGSNADGDDVPGQIAVAAVLTGPYGENIVENLEPDANVLCVAGGTGITFVLPVLLSLARHKLYPGRKVELVWAVRGEADLQWIKLRT